MLCGWKRGLAASVVATGGGALGLMEVCFLFLPWLVLLLLANEIARDSASKVVGGRGRGRAAAVSGRGRRDGGKADGRNWGCWGEEASISFLPRGLPVGV